MKKISDVMKNRTTLSFETFPPKTDKGMENLPGTLEHLAEWQPAYISCTYGAGGSNAGRQMEVLGMIKKEGRGAVPAAHITCIGQTKESVREQLQSYLDNGVSTVVALRGDYPYGWTGTKGDFRYATDLVRFIRHEFGDRFEVGVAGSPEGHIQAVSMEADIAHLKQKQDEGADFIVTQLTYDMEQFAFWFSALRKAGVNIPVDAGVMPVLTKNAVLTQCLSRNGCAIPRSLAVIFSHNWFDTDPEGNEIPGVREAFKEEGIAYTAKQIHRYYSLGVNGIHLYAMNKWKDVSAILEKAGTFHRNP